MFTTLFRKKSTKNEADLRVKKARILYQQNERPAVWQVYYRTVQELVENVFTFTAEMEDRNVILITDVMSGLRLKWDAEAVHFYFISEKITFDELLTKLKKL